MKRLAFIALLLIGSMLPFPVAADATVTLGPNPLPGRSAILFGGPASTLVNTVVPGAVLSSPFDGVITRWRAQRTDGPGFMQPDTIALRVLHPTGTADEFLGTGASDSHSLPSDTDPIGVREFTTSLPIRAGDFVGYDSATDYIPAASSASASYSSANGFPDGQSASFVATPGWYELINADVDPELTSITAAPKGKVKTRKKRVRVAFAFSSNAPGVGFSCSLDGTSAATCASPDSFRASRGRHSFEVQATYLGSAFGAPATDSFRVKRKK